MVFHKDFRIYCFLCKQGVKHLEKMKILIIEDDNDLREILTQFLTRDAML